MLDWCVKTFRLLVPNTEEGSAHVGTYLVPTERGPPFCKNIPADRYPTCVPKARWVCVSVEHNRIGLLAPEEFLAGQQLSLADYMPLDERYWDLVCKEFKSAGMLSTPPVRGRSQYLVCFCLGFELCCPDIADLASR